MGTKERQSAEAIVVLIEVLRKLEVGSTRNFHTFIFTFILSANLLFLVLAVETTKEY